ncbi:helix-turn-helix domain-containing protein [Hymenobacter lucidus]|uniref:Helix-turn-helix domain-containing protein n=1 Tax=Hymenobacter lucidus TaxID=2880930 RepID=A0ABS8ATS6_9BACT|nr:helix-turn-helix domain-containing protein [Hymenobacter lucidus]MCB2409630.1 helix-turn-helix domain-containing protein [Hymenobacter lucidus]
MSRRRDTLKLSKSHYRFIRQYLQQETRTAQGNKRAQVVLYWHLGLTGSETADQLAIPKARVYALRRAFKRQGLQLYLNTSKQGGAPTKLTPQVKKALGQLVAQPSAKPWSLRRLATHLVRKGLVASISAVTVAKALHMLKAAEPVPN